MEDFTYSKTSHLGYIRDHRSRAGLSALTTSSHETLSIHLSQLAGSSSSSSSKGLSMHLNQFPNLCLCTQRFRAGVKQPSAEPILQSHRHVRQLTHSLVMQLFRLISELTLCKACERAWLICRVPSVHRAGKPSKQRSKAIKKKLHVTVREGCYCSEWPGGTQLEPSSTKIPACGFRKNDLKPSLLH